ncbi:MAG: hypothetical protein ACI4M3_08175 [Acutalibacteraceae bacterium]
MENYAEKRFTFTAHSCYYYLAWVFLLMSKSQDDISFSTDCL